MLREPVGAAGIMVPWNSPVIPMVCSLAPIVAAGTTVVIRMPSQTVQINALLARVMSEAPSLPRGVITIFT
jgi:betaine-aldehyde dehydrogenase